jgi:hypothetical protein
VISAGIKEEIFLSSGREARSDEHMTAKVPPGLFAWSEDLEGSSDVRLRELEGFAMLLGWLEKFVVCHSLGAGRGACARFWREQVMAKPRDPWQLEQWGAAIRWDLRWLRRRLSAVPRQGS